MLKAGQSAAALARTTAFHSHLARTRESKGDRGLNEEDRIEGQPKPASL